MSLQARRLGLVVLAATQLAATWPDEARWLAVERDGAALTDPADAADPALDLGATDTPAASWYVDEDHLYVRLLVAGEPGPTWAVPGRRYGVQLDLDADDLSYEAVYTVSIDGLVVFANTAASEPGGWPDPPDAGGLVLAEDPFEDDLVRVEPSAGGGWWLGLALPRAAVAQLSTDSATALRIALVTDDRAQGAWSVDVAGASGAAATLAEVWSDPLVFDADGDGLSLGGEHAAGTDPYDPDSDSDGLLDGAEVGCPLDGPADDRDGDGIADLDEGEADSDSDGAPDFCDDDDDGDGWSTWTEGTVDTDSDDVPDYLDDDSDGDGTLDEDEPLADTDCDGARDRLDADDGDGPCGDADADGLDNAEEERCGTDPTAADTDGDGVLDGLESCDDDSDGDGVVDALDPEDGPGEPGGGAADTSGTYGLSGGAFGGGGGCSSAGSAPGGAGLLLGVAFAIAALRRRRVAAGAVALALAAAPPAAEAQELNAQRHRPALGDTALWAVHSGRWSERDSGAFARTSTAREPFVYRTRTAQGDPLDTPILAHVTTLDLAGWLRVGRVRLGALVPLHLDAAGLGVSPTALHHLGDAGLDVDVPLLPRGGRRALSVGLRATAPTGDGRQWLGAPGPTGQLRVSGSHGRALQVSGEAGVLLERKQILGDLVLGNRLLAGAGVAWWAEPRVAIAAEAQVERILPAGHHPGATPAEATLSLLATPHPSLRAGLGAGVGLTGGLGAPAARLLAEIRWCPRGGLAAQ